MTLDPGGEHPHAQEGVCACLATFSADPPRMTRTPSMRCGLSSHRIEAAAAAELRRRD